MITYLFKRLLAMIPTLFGISLITFLIVLLAPGDPVATQMGGGGGPGASAGGGGNDDPNRQADAKKAKMKLLGWFDAYLTKPIETDHLLALVDRLTQSTDRSTRQISAASSMSCADFWTAPVSSSSLTQRRR